MCFVNPPMSNRNKRPRTTLEACRTCADCGTEILIFEAYNYRENFHPNEIILATCGDCRKCWYFCQSCKISRPYTESYLNRHGSTKTHIKNNLIEFPQDAQQENNTAQQGNEPENQANEAEVAAKTSSPPRDDKDGNCPTPDNNEPYVPMVDEEMKDAPVVEKYVYPRLKMEGNEWLEKAFKESEFPSITAVSMALESPEVVHMRNFYASEHAVGEGKCGGGLSYLAARAFQQCKTEQLDQERLPRYKESKWQMINMIQYQSMNEKQRRRQDIIHQAHLMTSKGKLFQQTCLPPYNELGKYYGSTGNHSMYNNLPCPRAQDIDGVAYTRPSSIIAFIMANGIPIDDILVTADSPSFTEPENLRRVHNVDECKKAAEWIRDIQRNYYGSESGAPISNSNFGAPKHPAVVCLYLSDWADGFDSGKVKSNRNSIDSKTFTVSPPKHLVNATDNTFPVAIGLKKAKGWKRVERMFHKEVEELTNSSEPILFYNGTVKRMVPCFFRRFAVLSDKQERNGLTGTLGCGSDIHRCFGVSGKIVTPSCKLPALKEHLKQGAQGARVNKKFGWSEKFIERNGNGAIFPSCSACRADGLEKLFGLKDFSETLICDCCQKWDLIPPDESCNYDLEFPAHKDYPTRAAEGSPVLAPVGRDLFQEGNKLPFVRITWKLMTDACKFAFYQASRTSGWTKGQTTNYLKNCGVSTKLAELLHETAKAAKNQNDVDYFQDDKIGDFEFDPAWLSREISLQDYIEAVMHQLFLGAAESNFDLTTTWLSDTPAAAKLGHTTFLQMFQVLIKDLRGFNLSWLLAYPLTGKKGKLGTGSWVAENWVFFVRISQVVFGWCKNSEQASKYGVDDMSRMVIAFHAFVARCLTHAGIDGGGIKEAELYLKEFLSALREFDVRVRHEKLNKPVQKVSERKGTEAWWLKPNYMSLCNLLYILRQLGPLVLWWDGGGKGEKFIQVIKPHIKKGVREDAKNFFVSLLEKLYRVIILGLFEERYDLGKFEFGEDKKSTNEEDEDEISSVTDLLNEIADLYLPDEDQESTGGEDEEGDDEEEEEEESEEENPRGATFDESYFSTNQAHGMTKKKAFYVYRNEKELNESISSQKPVTGIVEVKENEDGEKEFEFQVVFRKPVKMFARRRVVFGDNKGLFFHGMWYAPITVEGEDEDELPPTGHFAELQGIAKLSAMAIPLWYIIGKEKTHSNKYCVITNWWKYRMKDGVYGLPTLDPELYKPLANNFDWRSMMTAAGTKNHSGRNSIYTGTI